MAKRNSPIVYWEINAKDGPALAEFYRDVFEWESSVDDTGFYSFKSGSAGGIDGGIFTGKGLLPPHRALYIEVEDIKIVLERVARRGAEILLGPFESGNAILAFFR
ncbi:MAG: bleomycin resistance protein, partial [Mesotoga sp.]|nr:bleomycin resistance protein [Mesotoga sp.]